MQPRLVSVLGLLFVLAGTALVAGGTALVSAPLWSGVKESSALLVPPPSVPSPDLTLVVALHDACRPLGEGGYACYRDGLRDALDTKGSPAAFAVLGALVAEDDYVDRQSHSLAHDLGRFAYDHYADEREAFASCPPAMASGCYHGVLEAFLTSVPVVRHKDVASLCDAASGRGQFQRFQCLHGLGHGLDMHVRHDFLRALAYCDYLPTEWERESCYGGVFMENIVSYEGMRRFDMPGHEGHHVVSQGVLKQEDPLYPCDAVDARYLRSCYFMQSSAILFLNGFNVTDGFSSCDRAESDYVSLCYQSMGRDISGFALRDAGRVNDLCGLGDPARVDQCLVGAVKEVMNNAGAVEPGFLFCGRVAPSHKAACYGAVGEMSVILTADSAARLAACEAAEESYVASCRGP